MDKQSSKKGGEGTVKVWLGEDGIIYTYLGGRLSEEHIKKFIEEKIKVLKMVEGKTGSFADLSDVIMSDLSMAGPAKRMIVGELKELESQKVDRYAVYGKGAALKVIGIILGIAVGIKKTKSFNNKEKALEWLKNKND